MSAPRACHKRIGHGKSIGGGGACGQVGGNGKGEIFYAQIIVHNGAVCVRQGCVKEHDFRNLASHFRIRGLQIAAPADPYWRPAVINARRVAGNGPMGQLPLFAPFSQKLKLFVASPFSGGNDSMEA